MNSDIKTDVENNVPEKKTSVFKSRFMWKVLGIFTLVLVLICFICFIFSYDSAYDKGNDGGYLSPHDGVVFLFVIISLLAFLAAVILKGGFKKRVSFLLLFLISIVTPILCYNANYHLLKKEGPLNFLVDKGGIFHFIVIGDYNFDGMNDEEYHILYDERTVSNSYAGHYDDTIVKNISTTAKGIGRGLGSTWCSYSYEDKIIKLHVEENVEYKEIKVTVKFEDPLYAEKVKFFYNDKEILYTSGIEGNSVTICFDAEQCAEFQNNIEDQFGKILIKYVVEE